MTREHQTDEQAQEGAAAPEGQAFDISFGLPPPLFSQLKRLGPDDAAALADMVKAHPNLGERIMSAASYQLGLTVVNRAKSIVAGNPEAEATKSETAPIPNKPSNATLADLDREDEHKEARKYNDAHPAYVAEFNKATSYSCMGVVSLSPGAVAQWQEDHGLKKDGKVGPQTVAAARKKGTGSALDHGLTEEQLDAAQRYNDAHPALLAKLIALWNDASASAIAAFQKLKAITVDGRVGPETIAMAEKGAKPENALLE